ncbi:type II toxin-antitoxin system PemK/MazF family toxin [bacterium]|nr:type II toxin-antitoxin system PemK/MazF family toxin [bacterium]MDB4206126.1 type II toxin-antitoxin system PemK/MazF family toxin [bacterium]
MLTSGDIVSLDLGQPKGCEASYLHPAVVITAQRILDAHPTVIQVVPLTSTLRGFMQRSSSSRPQSTGLRCPRLHNVNMCVPSHPTESITRWATSDHFPYLKCEKRPP